MNIEKKTYKEFATAHAPKSPLAKNCLWAFCSGGFICTLGQLFTSAYKVWGLSEDDAGTLTSVTLIFLAALFTGLGIFDALYARNANVFAAMPSLHSAYTFVAFIYAFRCRSSVAWKVVLGAVTVGIWFTAVYTSHHYILDVLAGIATALVGTLLFEYVLMKTGGFARFVSRYAGYVAVPAKNE